MFWPVHQSSIVPLRFVLSFTVVYFSAGTAAIMVRWKPGKCPTWGESDEEGHLDPPQVCPHCVLIVQLSWWPYTVHITNVLSGYQSCSRSGFSWLKFNLIVIHEVNGISFSYESYPDQSIIVFHNCFINTFNKSSSII